MSEIRAMLVTGASAGSVHDALTTRQANDSSYLPNLDIPSLRTISNIARDMTRDESSAWTLEDSDPVEAPLALRVLKAVVLETKGRVRHLTRREAHIAAVYLALRPGIGGSNPHRQAWTAYVRARTYLALLNRGDDPASEHLDIATQAELESGLVYQPGMIDPMVKEEATRG